MWKKILKYLINVENLSYFTDKTIKVAYVINIDNQTKHANSMKTITSILNITGTDIIHNNKIMEKMANIYANLKNQYTFKFK